MWSIGAIAHVMLAGIPPFYGKDDTELHRNIVKQELLFTNALWKSISPEGVDFIKRCLMKDEKLRPSAREALKHPWILGIN